MELQQLRYFCAIAETGSFSRAAEQTHVSQPSLSQQIRKLEDELGARLFDRLGRSIRLTELGQAFLPRARGVLRDLEAARGEVNERKAAIEGPVRVGVIPTIAPYFLPPFLAGIRNHGEVAGIEANPVRLASLGCGTKQKGREERQKQPAE